MKALTMKAASVLSVILLVVTSCSKGSDPIPRNAGRGSISIKGSMNQGVDEITSRAAPDITTFTLTVTNSEQTVVHDALFAAEGVVIGDLPVGVYTVTLTSRKSVFIPAFESPVYSATKSVTVGEGTTQNVVLECKQSNTGVRFVFDQSLEGVFANVIPKVTQGTNSLVYRDADKLRTGHFNAADAVMTLSDGTNPITIGGNTEKLLRLAAQELWTITLKVTEPPTPSGSISITATVNIETIDKSEEVEIDHPGTSGPDGTEASPFTIDIIASKIGQSGKWVEGYIVGSSPETRSGQTKDNILMAASASQTDPAKCVRIDLRGSQVQSMLNLVDNPDLAGAKVVVKGDVVQSEPTGTLATVTQVADQKGGKEPEPEPGAEDTVITVDNMGDNPFNLPSTACTLMWSTYLDYSWGLYNCRKPNGINNRDMIICTAGNGLDNGYVVLPQIEGKQIVYATVTTSAACSELAELTLQCQRNSVWENVESKILSPKGSTFRVNVPSSSYGLSYRLCVTNNYNVQISAISVVAR